MDNIDITNLFSRYKMKQIHIAARTPLLMFEKKHFCRKMSQVLPSNKNTHVTVLRKVSFLGLLVVTLFTLAGKNYILS